MFLIRNKIYLISSGILFLINQELELKSKSIWIDLDRFGSMWIALNLFECRHDEIELNWNDLDAIQAQVNNFIFSKSEIYFDLKAFAIALNRFECRHDEIELNWNDLDSIQAQVNNFIFSKYIQQIWNLIACAQDIEWLNSYIALNSLNSSPCKIILPLECFF